MEILMYQNCYKYPHFDKQWNPLMSYHVDITMSYYSVSWKLL